MSRRGSARRVERNGPSLIGFDRPARRETRRGRLTLGLLVVPILALLVGLVLWRTASPDNPAAFLADPASRNGKSIFSLRALPSAIPALAILPATPTPRPATTQTPSDSPRGSQQPGPAAASGQPPPLAFIDPGHGGVDVGTQGVGPDGQTIYEKDIALTIATQVAQILRHDGVGVVLSRSDDSLPGSVPADYTKDGQTLTPDGVLHDLQRRIDRADASGAIVLLSIHLNAFTDPSVGGSETFYDPDRTFSGDDNRFATLVQTAVVNGLRGTGYDVDDRGVTDDSSLQTDGFGTLGVSYDHLILLGPPVAGRLRASQMPGALSEPLFLSNPSEAALAIRPDVQQALARAYATAIEQFIRN